MYAVENTVPSMVVDFGSHTTKFGSAGEDLPHNIFRSSVGIIASTFSMLPSTFVVDVVAFRTLGADRERSRGKAVFFSSWD